jgi:hypothetical protein
LGALLLEKGRGDVTNQIVKCKQYGVLGETGYISGAVNFNMLTNRAIAVKNKT